MKFRVARSTLAGMTSLSCLCFIACGFAGSVLAVEQRPPFLGDYLRESLLIYPDSVAEWTLVDETRHEQVKHGISLRYQDEKHADRWVDVHVTPSGTPRDARFATVFEEHLAGLVAASEELRHQATIIGSIRTFDAPGDLDFMLGELAVKPRSATLVIDQSGTRYHSILAMTSQDMHYLKVRYSVEASAEQIEAARTTGEQFLAAFARVALVRNTGSCFRELQVEDFPADGRKPANLLASAGDGLPSEVWVAEGRLYVNARADDSARDTAVRFGRAMHDAVAGHCVGAESMNAAIPQGMRKLRLNYAHGASTPAR